MTIQLLNRSLNQSMIILKCKIRLNQNFITKSLKGFKVGSYPEHECKNEVFLPSEFIDELVFVQKIVGDVGVFGHLDCGKYCTLRVKYSHFNFVGFSENKLKI